MSRDQIVNALMSCGAFSLLKTIEEIEAGRARRIRFDTLPADPALSREVIEFIRSFGADVDLVRSGSHLHSVG